MASAPRTVSAKEIEASLRRLRGVLAARVVHDTAGGIQAVHTVADASRPAKMVVRDIESVLLAQWGIALDHNKISVAQHATGPIDLSRYQRPRLRIGGVVVTEEGGQRTARVALRQGDAAEAVGVATGPEDEDRARLVASAALRAVEGGGQGEGALRLLDLTRITLAGRAAVTLLVALTTDRGDDLLTGSALDRGDPDRAVVAATLDAVNRRLTVLEAAARGERR